MAKPIRKSPVSAATKDRVEVASTALAKMAGDYATFSFNYYALNTMLQAPLPFEDYVSQFKSQVEGLIDIAKRYQRPELRAALSALAHKYGKQFRQIPEVMGKLERLNFGL